MLNNFTIAPAYAPLLLLNKYYSVFERGVFRLVKSGDIAFRMFTNEIGPHWILLSLADLRSSIQAIRKLTQDLLTFSTEAGVKVIIDSGGLEGFLISSKYFQDTKLFTDPLTNLREQLSIKPPPDIITFLDDLRQFSPLRKLLEVEDDLIHEIQAADRNVKTLLVIHKSDMDSITLLQSSKLLEVVNEVALSERELIMSPSLLDVPMILKKQFVVFGLDNLSLEVLRQYFQSGAHLGDSASWITRRLTPNDWELESVPHYWRAQDDAWLGLTIEALVKILVNNLLFLRETECRIIGES